MSLFIITNRVEIKMIEERKVQGICINPGFNLKEPVIKLLYEPSQVSEAQPFSIVVCRKCQKPLQNLICINVQDSNYCIGCFSQELPECEEYRIKNPQSRFPSGNEWSLEHELLLLKGLENFRFGSWKEAQKMMEYMGTKYSQEELEKYYTSVYGKMETQQPIQNNRIQSAILEPSDRAKTPNQIDPPFQRAKTNKQSHGDQSSQRKDHKRTQKSNEVSSSCFNPKREVFIIEYNDDLQKYICDIQFRDDQTPEQFQLKMQLLEAYNVKLAHRYEKYDFILEHKLLNQSYQEQQKKKMENNSFFKAADEILKPTMRLCKFDEYQSNVKSLQFCLKLQSQIEGLRELRACNLNYTLESIAKIQKPNNLSLEQGQQEGKPRKRVHKNEPTKKQDKHQVISELGLTVAELEEAFESAKEQNEPFYFKGVQIRHFKKFN